MVIGEVVHNTHVVLVKNDKYINLFNISKDHCAEKRNQGTRRR